jgi:hypothetical protein
VRCAIWRGSICQIIFFTFPDSDESDLLYSLQFHLN